MKTELELHADILPDILSFKQKRFEQNRGYYVSQARGYVETFFGFPLTMGQRMLLRQHVYGCILEHKKVGKLLDSFDPDREAAVMFIAQYYPGLPIDKICSMTLGLSWEKDRREFIARDRNYE